VSIPSLEEWVLRRASTSPSESVVPVLVLVLYLVPWTLQPPSERKVCPLSLLNCKVTWVCLASAWALIPPQTACRSKKMEATLWIPEEPSLAACNVFSIKYEKLQLKVHRAFKCHYACTTFISATEAWHPPHQIVVLSLVVVVVQWVKWVLRHLNRDHSLRFRPTNFSRTSFMESTVTGGLEHRPKFVAVVGLIP
jgi:hypothetical protein